LVERSVPGLHDPELRVRQRAGELAALLRRPGAVVAAVYDDRGLPDAGQLAGQVEVALAGKDVVGGLLADRRRPSEEPGAGLIVQRFVERTVQHRRRHTATLAHTQRPAAARPPLPCGGRHAATPGARMRLACRNQVSEP